MSLDVDETLIGDAKRLMRPVDSDRVRGLIATYREAAAVFEPGLWIRAGYELRMYVEWRRKVSGLEVDEDLVADAKMLMRPGESDSVLLLISEYERAFAEADVSGLRRWGVALRKYVERRKFVEDREGVDPVILFRPDDGLAD